MAISDDNDDPVEEFECQYFGCVVRVWRIKGPYWGCSPWRFSVCHNGKTRNFTGVPNYMNTKKAALKKAWWRAKWLHTGKLANHYTVMVMPSQLNV